MFRLPVRQTDPRARLLSRFGCAGAIASGRCLHQERRTPAPDRGPPMPDAAAAPPSLRLEIEPPLGFILADNSARRNAFTAAMWRALPGLVAAAEADERVRVLVVRGAGEEAFSAGADISEFEAARTGENARDYDRLNHEAFAALTACAKPTLAMIHGPCLGGGLALAVCCDLRLAAQNAKFAIPAARLGIGYNPRWLRPLLAVVP